MFDYLLNHTPLLYLTQSLWRDEAFSILAAQQPLIPFLKKLALETPLYYICLHFWMLIFGSGEIAVRSLSLLGYTGAVIIMIFWGEKLYKTHWLSWFLPVFFAVNPMLLYYAFEIRTYGFFMFFAAASLFAYSQSAWKWYTISAILGCYTHSYFVFVPFVCFIHSLILNHKQLFQKPLSLLRHPWAVSSYIIGLAMSPYLIRFAIESKKLTSSWYFPVDLQLFKSVLGNMFIGYEGTPWYLWQYTAILSVFLLIAFAYAITSGKMKRHTSLMALTVFVPLGIILSLSLIKPLFVNRYLLPVTIGEILLLVVFLHGIRNATLQKILAGAMLLFVLGFNLWYPDKHAKLPIRDTILEINTLLGVNGVILVETPLLFFESIYYSVDPKRVYLYNPSNSPFPWYVGESIVDPKQITTTIPSFPTHAYIVHADGSYDMIYAIPKTAQTQTQ